MACIGEGGVTIGFEAGADTGHKPAIHLTGDSAIQSIEHICWTALCGVAENADEQGDKHRSLQSFARDVTENDDATIEDIVKVSANLLVGQVGCGYLKVFGGALATGDKQVLHLPGCFQFLRQALLCATVSKCATHQDDEDSQCDDKPTGIEAEDWQVDPANIPKIGRAHV